MLGQGGSDGLSQRPSQADLLYLSQARESGASQFEERRARSLLSSMWPKGTPQAQGEGRAGVDVPPHTLADLQAQGRTPTEATTQPRFPPGSKSSESGTVSEVAPETEAGHRGTPGVEGLICAYPWPQGCNYWTGIARCESTLGQDPSAYADSNPYVGLLQIWVGHGYGREWLKVDANNVLAAWELSHEGTRTSLWPYCQWQ